MQVVPVTMKEDTLSKVDRVKDRVRAPSRSDAVRRAVELMDIITNAVESGKKVMIESAWGQKKEISINGMKPSDETAR